MRELFGNARFAEVLALFWIALTTCFCFVLSIFVLADAKFSLNFGLIRTTGIAGLLITLVPALVGLLGLVLHSNRRSGAALMLFYSCFWALVTLSGLPFVWHAKQSFCIQRLNFCIVTPWITRLAVLVLAAPFFLAAEWSASVARRAQEHT